MRNGKLPSLVKGWQWRKLGDCAQFINGRAYSQEELLDSGTPVLRIQNLNGGDRWYYSNLKLPDEKYCEAGDLLYTWSASFGPYRFTGPKSIFHYHIWRVIPGEELDRNFAFHLLGKITNEVKSAAHGVAMLHMTKGGIEAWPIPLPPLAEQLRIAEILDRAEALRAKRRTALAQLDTLPQAIFVDLFGDPATNPKHWSVIQLGDVISSASDGPHVSPQYVESGIPFLSTRHIRLSGIIWEDLKYISLQDAEIHWQKCKPERGDILYTKGGTTGIAKVVDFDQPTAIWVHIALLKTDKSKVEPLWLEGMLNSQFCYQQSQRLTHGIANRDLGLTRMVTIRMYLPPPLLQREFARCVTAVEKLKTAHRASLAEMDALFASLQHRAFRGEL